MSEAPSLPSTLVPPTPFGAPIETLFSPLITWYLSMADTIYARDTSLEVQGKIGYDRWQWKDFLVGMNASTSRTPAEYATEVYKRGGRNPSR